MPRDQTLERDASLPRTGPRIPVAGVWRRIGAVTIDDAILLPVLVAVHALAGGPLGDWVPRLLLATGAITLYFGLFEGSSLRGTPGKLAFGLVVADVDGGPIGLLRGLVRGLVRVLSAIPLGLGYLFAFGNRERRTLHDLAAGTVVLAEGRSLPAGSLALALIFAIPLNVLAAVAWAPDRVPSYPAAGPPGVGPLAACAGDPAEATRTSIPNVPLPQPVLVREHGGAHGEVALEATTAQPLREARREIREAVRGRWKTAQWGTTVGGTVTDTYILKDHWVLTYRFEPCSGGTDLSVERY